MQAKKKSANFAEEFRLATTHFRGKRQAKETRSHAFIAVASAIFNNLTV